MNSTVNPATRSKVYQSGQKIVVSGVYEVAGTKPTARYHLESGNLFPDYYGRAVCWHLLAVHISDRNAS